MADFGDGNVLLTLSAKQHAALVTFEYLSLTVRWTNWDTDIVSQGQTFQSLPSMAIQLPRINAGVSDAFATIRMPKSLAPANKLTTGERFAPVKVTIEEIMPKSDITRRIMFVGEVASAVRRKDDDLADLKMGTTKSKLNVPLGLPVLATCPWRFGDDNCTVDLNPLKQLAVITNIDGPTVTFDDLSPNTEYARYHRGYVERDEVRIAIRNYTVGNVVDLFERPPSSWEGLSVTVVPGCDKLPLTCLLRWNNIQQFCGIGFKMPRRHPIYDLPDSL